MELNVIQHLKSYWNKIKFIGLTDKDEEFADATSEHSVRASKFLKGLNLDPIMPELNKHYSIGHRLRTKNGLMLMFLNKFEVMAKRTKS